MKLNSFAPDTVPEVIKRRSTKPYLAMSAKGLVRISNSAAQKFGVKAKSKVVLHQDQDNEENWYLEVAKESFELRDLHKPNNGLAFNCKYLVEKVFDSMSFVGSTGRVLVGEKINVGGKSYWTLITQSLQNK